MVRSVDYDKRRRGVLASVVNRYIKNAAPVASEELAQEFELSSATIRNILAELEEAGYLTHPYTSAGRTPTEKGYRYYVDFLLAQFELIAEEKERIIRGYERQLRRLEDALELTSEVIAGITHYTSIVSFVEWHDRFFYNGVSFILEQPEFHDYNRVRLLIRAIEDKQRMIDIINRDFKERVKIYIGEELGCPEMKNCSLAVSSYGRKNKPLGRLAVLGPVRMEYDHIVPTLEYVSEVLSDALSRI